MKNIFITIFLLLAAPTLFAANTPDELKLGSGNGSIFSWVDVQLVSLLTLIQSLLVKLILPIVIIWGSLYIAYELFTADGDEARLKKAWRSVAYSAIALVSIWLSYALVTIISRLSI